MSFTLWEKVYDITDPAQLEAVQILKFKLLIHIDKMDFPSVCGSGLWESLASSSMALDVAFYIIQLLPLSEGDMTICSPEAGDIARGRRAKPSGNITCRG